MMDDAMLPFPCAWGSFFLPFPRKRGKVPKAEGGNRCDGPLPPSGHLPPLRRGRERLYLRLAIIIMLLGLVVAPIAHAIDPLPFKDHVQEVRFQNLTKQLRCLVCQNQDLGDSDADLAKDLRKQVFDMMQSGKSDEEIKQYLVARYNDFVLYDPPLKPGTWLLWFAPFALVIVGAFVVVRILRRRTRLALATIEPEEDW